MTPPPVIRPASEGGSSGDDEALPPPHRPQPPDPVADAFHWWLRGTPNPAGDPVRDAAHQEMLPWTLLDSVADAVLVTEAEPWDDPGPRIVFANQSFLDHTGYELGEILGRNPRFLQGPDTDRSTLDRLRAALEAWEPITVELLNYRKDGSPFWVEIAVAPVADSTGWFTHWVSVQRDVTDRRARAAKDHARERFLQSVLASLPAQTAVLAPDGTIVAVNAAWESFYADNGGTHDGPVHYGREGNYLSVCTRSAGMGCDQAATAWAGIEAVVRGDQESFHMDYECSSPAQERWFHLSVVPLLGAGDEGALRHVITSHADITARKVLERRLIEQARTDLLTGLPNRAGLAEHLDRVLTAGREDVAPLALLLLDLDGFRRVNDSLGHAAGDELLVEVAAAIRGVIGPDDFVARTGGDEFAVVTPTNLLAAQRLAHRLQGAVARPRDVAGQRVLLTASTGISVASPGLVTHAAAAPGLVDANRLLRDADTALYGAKAAGGASLQVFTPELGADAERMLGLVTDLREAPRDGSLRLVYQPIVDLVSGDVVKREALLRWEHGGELLTPDRFLDVAERSGLMVDIGSWVIRQACHDAATWRRDGDLADVTVNVAAQQLDPGLVTVIGQALAASGLPGDALVVEVTETSVVSDLGAGAEVLAALRRLGVRVFIDDFGTGYCSLVYLTSLPIDGLKLDRQFVATLDTPGSVAVVAAVVRLAEALDLDTVAEGVETAEQRQAMVEAGYRLGQGWLFGRPVPVVPSHETPASAAARSVVLP